MSRGALMAWSGGKDSAMALHEIRQSSDLDVRALLTTLTEDYDRVSMHGIRRALLEQQAESLGLPLITVLIPKESSMETYEQRMESALKAAKADGVEVVAFGDIFLEDLKRYREDKLAQVGMSAAFPIWLRDTRELSRSFIDMGFRAVITCVDTQCLGGEFAGRDYDQCFLSDLPDGVDPCGENGEFHSFVHDGPIFASPVEFTRGEAVTRDDRFRFQDVVSTL